MRGEGKKKKKAVIFTLDAIFAVLIATSMIVASFLFFSKTDLSTYNQQDLYRASLDTLTVLEKDFKLKNAVETSSTAAIESYINSLPSQICANITIFDKESNMISSAVKIDCQDSTERIVASRVFIANNDVYYAKIKSWYQ